MENIQGLVLVLVAGVGGALLAKYRGRDPLRFFFLSLLFGMITIPYLCIVKTRLPVVEGIEEPEKGDDGVIEFEPTQEQIELSIALQVINGIGEKTADNIVYNFPDEESLSNCTIEELQAIPGVGPDVARLVKDEFY